MRCNDQWTSAKVMDAADWIVAICLTLAVAMLSGCYHDKPPGPPMTPDYEWGGKEKAIRDVSDDIDQSLKRMQAQKKALDPLIRELCPEVVTGSFKGDFLDQVIACDKIMLAQKRQNQR